MPRRSERVVPVKFSYRQTHQSDSPRFCSNDLLDSIALNEGVSMSSLSDEAVLSLQIAPPSEV